MDPARTESSRVLLGATGLAALASAPYLSGGPVWDDHTLIVQSLALLPLSELGTLWTQPVGGAGPGAGYYRPVAMTALAVLGRLGIPAIHLLAAALHVGSTALLWRLLGGSAAVLLFAVHPMAGEVLGWASALPDALAVFFSLLAAVLLPRTVLGATLALLAGILSKETALLPFVFLALGGLLPLRPALSAWGVAVVGAGAARLLAGTGADYAIWSHRHLIPAALAWPVASAGVPWPLTAVRDLLAAPAWVTPLGVGLLGGMLWWGRRSRLALAGAALLLAAPALALPPTLDGYLAAERYLYPGLVGLAMWATALKPPPRLLWLVGALALGSHLWRGPQWHSDRALFSAATRAMPSSSYAWHFYGMVAAQEGDMATAADAFGAAVETGHPHPLDRLLRLRALVESGQHEAACAWAADGPDDGLTAEYIAWWARAAWEAGRVDDARRLIGMLQTPDGWDGPPWVGALAAAVQG